MITSDKGWELYNELMNQLREAIATKVKVLCNVTEFYYWHSDDSFSTVQEKGSIIEGVCLEEETMVIIKDSQGETNNYTLYYEGLEPQDLIGILDILEK